MKCRLAESERSFLGSQATQATTFYLHILDKYQQEPIHSLEGTNDAADIVDTWKQRRYAELEAISENLGIHGLEGMKEGLLLLS